MTVKYKYENLEVGRIYKNYKELCESLGCDVQSGNSKKSQFRDWECHFRFSKMGNKFIIDEVFEAPKERENNHGGARTIIFGDIIELLVLDLLVNCDEYLVIGKVKLMELIGMTNINYQNGKSLMNKLSIYLGTDIKVVQDFYKTNDSNFKSAVESALNRLKAKRLITFTTVTKVKDRETKKYRIAEDEELKAILLVENRVMRTLGYYKIEDVRKSGDWHKFKNQCRQLLQGITDIDYYFSAYKIITDKEYVEKEKINMLNMVLEASIKNNSKSELNRLIIENIDKNATKRHENADNSKLEEYKSIRSSENYVEDINKLSSILISENINISLNDLLKEIIAKDKRIETHSLKTDTALDDSMINYIDEMLEML